MPNDATIPNSAKRKRRRSQLSLRTFLLLILIFGGWIGWWARSAEQQKKAIADLKRVGALAKYEYQNRSNRNNPTSPNGFDWLNELVGKDYFNTITRVDVVGNPPIQRIETQPMLDGLQRLPSLHRIAFFNVDQVDLEPISKLQRLKSIFLINSQLQHFENWQAFGSLEELIFDRAPFEWELLKEIPNLKRLEVGLYPASRETEFADLCKSLPDCVITGQSVKSRSNNTKQENE